MGVTRAQEDLILTRSAHRKRYGKMRKTAPSRFLASLPKELFKLYESGIRPITEDQRQMMLSDLYKKLDQKSLDLEKIER